MSENFLSPNFMFEFESGGDMVSLHHEAVGGGGGGVHNGILTNPVPML